MRARTDIAGFLDSPMKRNLFIVVVFSGGHALTAPPISWAPLQLILWALLLRTLDERTSARMSMMVFWLAGFGAQFIMGLGVQRGFANLWNLPPVTGWVPLLMVSAWAAIPLGLFGAITPAIQRTLRHWWPLALAPVWVIVNGRFPAVFANGIEHHWVDWARMMGAVSVFGPVAPTMIVLGGAGYLSGMQDRKWIDHRSTRWSLALYGLLVIGIVVTGHTRVETVRTSWNEGPTMRLALIQPNIHPKQRQAHLEEDPSGIGVFLIEQTRTVLAQSQGVDAVVWPENVIFGSPLRREHDALRQLALEFGVELWLGGISLEQSPQGIAIRTNSAHRIRSDGTVAERYDKRRLLLGAETVPWAKQGVGYQRGRRELTHELGDARFAFLICYEATDNKRMRASQSRGAAAVINLSSDALFASEWLAIHHLALVRLQAASIGMPVVRVATTGTSAVIDGLGQVHQQIGWDQKGSLVVDVPTGSAGALTGIAQYSWLVCLGITVIAMGLVGVRRRRSR